MGIPNSIARALWTYVIPIIGVFGLINNVLVIIVTSQSRMRARSSSVYIGTLAVVDCLVLLVGCLPPWTLAIGDDHWTINSDVWCQFTSFIYLFAHLLEPWILVNIATERLAAVWKPHKFKLWYSTSRVLIDLLVTFILCFVASALILSEFKVVPAENGTKLCHISQKFLDDHLFKAYTKHNRRSILQVGQ